MTLHRLAPGLVAISVLTLALTTQVGAATLETNDRFHDVAAAIEEGYAPIPCSSGANGGAMGIHYVNAAYLLA